MASPVASRGTSQCVKCQRRLQPGDRVIPAYIVEKVGVNPENVRQFGAWLMGEFELIHCDCENTDLSHSIIVGA